MLILIPRQEVDLQLINLTGLVRSGGYRLWTCIVPGLAVMLCAGTFPPVAVQNHHLNTRSDILRVGQRPTLFI